MRTIKLQINVRVPNCMSNKRAVELVNKMLDVGYWDATNTTNMVDSREAEEAVSLHISKPRIIKEVFVNHE